MHTTPTLDRFIGFVYKQPKDRKIDHSSYVTCAVGDFCREVMNDPVVEPDEKTYVAGIYAHVVHHPVLRKMHQEAGVNCENEQLAFDAPLVSGQTFTDWMADHTHSCDTYGSLANALQYEWVRNSEGFLEIRE